MVFFILILALLVFNGLEFSGAGDFNTDYLNKRNTTAVNGIFVVLVLLSHYSQYIELEGVYDEPYFALREHLNQMVVATFWFYSGYGMMEAIRRKGKEYVKKIPAKFWKLLFRMEIAIVIYLILNTLLGIEYPRAQVLLAFTLWTAIGNSNWYIFAVLGLYILIFISFAIGLKQGERKGRITGILLLFFLTCAFDFVLMRAGRPAYCYNTILIMPLGFLYSEFREGIERIFMKSDIVYFLILAGILAVYVVSFFHRYDYGLAGYTVWAFAFISLFILATAKICIYNPLLDWFGTHIFAVYILQRLSMIVLDHFGCIDTHKYISLVVVFSVTMLLALIFEKITDAIIDVIEKRQAGRGIAAQ